MTIRPLKLSDLNLCHLFSSPVNTWQRSIKFARNIFSECTINLKEWAELQPETKFSSIFLNFFENGQNFLQSVPIKVNNAGGNGVSLIIVNY